MPAVLVGAAGQRIGEAEVDRIVAARVEQPVQAVADAGRRVRVRFQPEGVVAGAAVEQIAAEAVAQDVVVGVARDRVVAVAAEDVFDAAAVGGAGRQAAADVRGRAGGDGRRAWRSRSRCCPGSRRTAVV